MARARGTKKNEQQKVQVTIPPANIQKARFTIEGTEYYCQNKFSMKAKQAIMEAQSAGSTAKKGKKRKPKDFDQAFRDSMHLATDGWCGIPASVFRSAAISACRLAGFKMTVAKLSVFVSADGFDAEDGAPLIRITKGKPERKDHYTRIKATVDIRSRAFFAPGWQAQPVIQWDADQFTLDDIMNLINRVGLQVGIGEGRNDSKNSAGMGWGSFRLVGDPELLD